MIILYKKIENNLIFLKIIIPMASSAVETRLNARISEYFDTMKKGFEDVIERVDNSNDQTMLKEFMNSIKPFSITQDDLLKRKRVKNIVPYFDRCLGKKSNGTQCTRRRKDGSELCGTTLKEHHTEKLMIKR